MLANVPAAESREEENAGLLRTATNNGLLNKNEQKLFNNQEG